MFKETDRAGRITRRVANYIDKNLDYPRRSLWMGSIALGGAILAAGELINVDDLEVAGTLGIAAGGLLAVGGVIGEERYRLNGGHTISGFSIQPNSPLGRIMNRGRQEGEKDG